MSCPHCGAELQPGARHCPECGRPLLVLTSLSARRYLFTDEAGREFPLAEGVTRVGRDPASNEIVLADTSISSRHAAIEVTSSAVVLRDLGSANGTYLNGVAIHRPVQLGEGNRVRFGDRELIFQRQASQPSAVPRGIPTPVRRTRPAVVESGNREGPALAVATIALTLLATLLHAVGLADGFQRDDLTIGLPPALAGLVALPLLAIVAIAAGRRWGYLIAVLAGLIGVAFVTVAGPIFTGSDVRNELTVEYGSTGYWFLAVVAVLALVVEILVLTVAFAGWRVKRPASSQPTMNRA